MAFHSYFTPFSRNATPSDLKLPKLNPAYTNLVTYPATQMHVQSPPPQRDRQGLLEWRIGVQETITVGMVEKISMLKEEMLEQLKYSKQLEKQQDNHKDVLRNELQALAESISRMNTEVHVFEENVRDKWKTVNEAAVTLRNLENHYTTSLADVRSRITRGDQAINVLSQKITQLSDELRSLNESHKREVQEVHGMMKANEQKMSLGKEDITEIWRLLQSSDLSSELDRTFQRTAAAIQRTQEELHRQMLEVESRLKEQLSETRQEIHVTSSSCLEERTGMETRIMNNFNELCHEVDQRVVLAEQKAEELKIDEEIVGRVDDVENDMHTFKQQVLNTFKEVEVRMNRLSDEIYSHHRSLIEAVREEMRHGFCTAHDTITNMKSVLETKLRISEENLHLELGQLRKLVILA